MNITVLNVSPKKKGGASRFFSKLLKVLLAGNKVTTADIRNMGDYENALSLLEGADAAVVSSPLYVDGIPAHMLGFLEKAEALCREKGCRFKLYIISNCGFIEGCQNKTHLNMYEAWCRRAGAEYGGGLGIGGGVMLHVLFVLFPLFLLLHCAQIALTLITAGYITSAALLDHAVDLLIIPVFFILPLICEILLASAVARGKTRKNLFTRALLPSFIFLPCADLFMLISALLERTLPHKLFHRIKLEKAVSETAKRFDKPSVKTK